MKIGIYDPFLDALGGGEKYMMTAAENLSRNHEVNIFWDNKDDIHRVEERFGLDLSNISVIPNVFSTRVSFLKRYLKSSQYDVLFYLSDGSIPVVGSKKLILHLQFPIEWVTIDTKTKLKLHRVSSVITNSEFTKKFVDKKLGIDSTMVYPPVEVKKIEIPKENIILHVGRFMKTGIEGEDYKKQFFMIDTFKELVDGGLKDWKFVIAAGVRASDLSEFQKMQNTAAGYPISFVVNATNSDLWKWYNRAKIYWHASGYGEDLNSHPEKAEHFGISTVEAMSAGAVPVVINAGGQKEIVVHNENGLFWNSKNEFISETLELTQSSKRLKELSKRAIKTSEKFTKEKFNSKIEEVVSR